MRYTLKVRKQKKKKENNEKLRKNLNSHFPKEEKSYDQVNIKQCPTLLIFMKGQI